MKKKILSFILAAVLVMCAVPFSAFAAEASVVTIDGERIAFVSTFGRMAYNGKSYVTYKSFDEAFSALGKDGGSIVFNGTLTISEFNDIEGRGPLTLKGTGAKARANIVYFSGIPEINLKGDITFDFVNLRTSADAFIFTNGNSISTKNDFDTYNTEQYVAGGENIFHYIDPPSLAPGVVKTGTASASLKAGTYKSLVAGAVGTHSINGNTAVTLGGGNVENAVAGNVGNGTMNGNAKLVIGEGNITKLVAGSSAGVINGNVTTVINGGKIASAVIGAEAGATINGNVIVALNGGDFAGTIEAGKGTVNGKKIVIAGADATVNLASGAADYLIKLSGGLCEPQYDGTTLTGFLFTDKYGVPATTITANGTAVSSESGIYQLSAGTSTVSVTSNITVGLNKNAKYIKGYETGEFRPQNNLTRAEAITLLARIVADETAINGKIKSNYLDAKGQWFESYIGFFEKLGYLDTIHYDSGETIRPNQQITRGEFVELIKNIAGLSNKSASTKLKNFSDVNESTDYAEAINFAVSENIVNGYEDGTFRPENNVTRAEVATMVNRYLGRTPNGAEGSVSFTDIADHWAKSQILAAAGNENETWTSLGENKYVLTGTSAKDYVPALYEQSQTLDADAIREGVDVIAEQMKKDILNTPNTSDIYADEMTGLVYYISEKTGNDENDGKTPQTAWKTPAGISKHLRLVKKGTAILFERGGVYRGQVPLITGAIFGSYGEGEKPVLMQSAKNYADPSLWVETEWENVWECTDLLVNVGVVAFDHDIYDFSDAAYDETYGLIMNPHSYGVNGPQDLCGDLQFFSVLGSNLRGSKEKFYLYSDKGNPGQRFKSIEIGENIHIMTGSPLTGAIVDNLSFKFGGGHGISMGTCKNITVTNCVFSWIGGSVLDENGGKTCTNYGNAIEIYGGCDGYHVENNWMYQIYDTGVTHQRQPANGTCVQKDINYLSNLIEYVFWGIEFYNGTPETGADKASRITENQLSAYNVLRKGGFGWGSITRYRSSQLYCCAFYSDQKNIRSEYNIFDRAYGNLLQQPANTSKTEVVDDKNIYIQYIGQYLGGLKGTTKRCDYDAALNIQKHWGDKNAITIVIDTNIEPLVRNIPESLAPRK